MDKIMSIKNKVRINEWSEMVKDCRSSGLTVQQWCDANGMNIKTYYYRLRKVREALCEETHDIVRMSRTKALLTDGRNIRDVILYQHRIVTK